MLYTLIIDYKGGTYITQSVSNNRNIAPSECIKIWDTNDIEPIINDEVKNEILLQLKNEELIPLKGLKNVWCGTITINEELMIINLVKTDNAT